MRLTPSFLLSALVAGAMVAHGCSTVASSVMVPKSLEIDAPLGGAVRIEAEGSPAQAWIGTPLVKASELEKALRDSVMTSGLFDEIVETGDADRVLRVEVERIDEPSMGLDQTCETAFRWQLRTGDGARTLWEKQIVVSETVNTFQETDSEKRRVRAIERAIQGNLRRGIRELSRAH